MNERYTNVYTSGDRIYTPNLVPGQQVYGEQLRNEDGTEYRRWDPSRSKLAAAIANGLDDLPIEQDSQVLYLGAASGTTPSHVSDIVRDGIVYGIEYSPQVTRDLLSLSEDRDNLAPVLADARRPDEYSRLIDQADLVFQDVAQPDQFEIVKRNTDMYLRDGGQALIGIKAKSISSSRPAKEVFAEQEDKMTEHFEIGWSSRLEPHEDDHKFYRLIPE
jgi:fibrillarin-like pre-rRNA processing protein